MDAQFKITPKTMCPTTYRTWILPSSRRLRFLHLTIYIRYVKGLMKLIKCCFAIIVMVDTIYFASRQNSFKFLLAFGIVHHVLLQHLEFYLDHATFSSCSDLWLGWGLKQSCNYHWAFQCVSHSICMHGSRVDFRLFVVESRTAILTPSLSFCHNLCCRCPNGSCKPILDI